MPTLVVWTNAIEGREDEYNDWYDNRHLPDVLQLPGVVAAQRFRHTIPGYTGDTSDYGYLALYEVEPGMESAVNSALESLAAERAEALAAGREPQLVVSPAMNPQRVSYWIEPVTERVTQGTYQGPVVSDVTDQEPE